MPQQVRRRRQATLSFTGSAFGSKQVQTLGRGMIYREINLRFYGSFTYGVGTSNAAGTLGRGDEWSAFSRISLIVNGTDTIRDFTGTQLFMINRLWYGVAKRPSTTLGDGSTAGPTFDSTLIIPLWQPDSYNKMDTVLDSSKLSDFRIEVTVAAASDINSANGPSAITASLDIESVESFGLEGNFSDCRMYQLQNVQSGANANTQIQLPVTCLYRGFFINAASSSGATGTDSTTAISNVQLVSGTTVFFDMPFPMLRDYNKMRRGQTRDLVQNGATSATITGSYVNITKSTLQNEDAWAFMDLVQDGYLGEGVDAVGFSELYLNLNVASATTITVIPVQIFPRRNAG